MPPFNMLGIYSQETTAAPTQPLSPGRRTIYVKSEELGRGEFGRVYRVNDVSTGLRVVILLEVAMCQVYARISVQLLYNRVGDASDSDLLLCRL